jgi:plastocyanin
LIALVVGCGDDNIINAPTDIVLSATPSQVDAGDTVTFTLEATAPDHTISATRIDFEDDGTWDRTHTHSSATVSSQFSHAFDTADSYLSRAEMLEGSQVLGSATVEVTVVVPGPRIALEILSLDTPAVRAEPDLCIFVVEDWTALFAAVPTSSQTSSPLDDIVMVSVDITYDWINDPLDGIIPPQAIGLGNVTIPAGGQNQVTFAPIPSDVMNFTTGTPPVSPFEGATANLTLTFNAITVDGTGFQQTALEQLIVEICH